MSSKAEERKGSIISDLREARRNILDATSSLTPEQQDEVFLGTWCVKDLLAHLVGWDLANLEAAQAILAARLPAFYAHHDRDWQTFNAHLVAEHKREDFAELVSSVEDSHQQLVAFLETVPAEEFDSDKGVRFKGFKVTIARTLQGEIKDEREHRAQIEAFAGRGSVAR